MGSSRGGRVTSGNMDTQRGRHRWWGVWRSWQGPLSRTFALKRHDVERDAGKMWAVVSGLSLRVVLERNTCWHAEQCEEVLLPISNGNRNARSGGSKQRNLD
jgi:hypothetical protein